MEFKAFQGDTFIAEKVKELVAKLGVKEAIETGTHKGDTTQWLAEHFTRVYTVEVDKQYEEILSEKFKYMPNVFLQYGDTLKYLQLFLPLCVGNPMVFLDAHWFKNPLKGELKLIAESGKKPLLVIHDFYNPNKPEYQFDSYPELSYKLENVKVEIESIYGSEYVVEYNGKTNLERGIGCIFIYPKQ